MGAPAGHGMSLAQKIVTWAQGQLGKTVASGECWDLPQQALSLSGAQTSSDLGDTGPDSDYVWGTAYSDPKDARAGDIVQFRDYTVTLTVATSYRFTDGTTDDDVQTEDLARPHHSALVARGIDRSGRMLTYEQNIEPDGKVVQQKELYTRDATLGGPKTGAEMRYNPTKDKMEQASFTRVTSVHVDGTMWLYHPKAK